MKYIKTYEEIELKYKDDDYILVDVDKIFKDTGNLKSDLGQEPAKIIKIDINLTTLDYHFRVFPFLVQFSNGNYFNINYDEIIRDLTPEEIEDYETTLASKKFNL